MGSLFGGSSRQANQSTTVTNEIPPEIRPFLLGALSRGTSLLGQPIGPTGPSPINFQPGGERSAISRLAGLEASPALTSPALGLTVQRHLRETASGAGQIFCATPRMVGLTIGMALRMLSRLMCFILKPASSIASAASNCDARLAC